MTYHKRLTLLILLDSLIVTFAIFAATWIVYPNITSYSNNILIITAIALLASHHLFAMIYKLYNKVWAYASVGELFAIVKAVTFSIITAGIVQYLINDFAIYKRALIITWLLHIVLIGGSRFAWRIVCDRYIISDKGKARTLIVGAGSAGTMIARQLTDTEKFFVLVSSGKSVISTNVMTASTKCVAEMVIQHLVKTSKTKFDRGQL